MRIGSLFSGYGGLDMAVEAVTGASLAWVSDIDPGSCTLLAHRCPDVPNLGDISAVNWSAVEPVDVLTGGFPCQDVSHAGKRAGLRPDTRSGLWSQMAYAIDQLRPSLVVAENVRGLLSAEAHSDLEPCPWCLGDGTGQPPLRALGAVLGDLAELGYDASWCGLRAADVGAPHGRFRVFVVAYPRGVRRDAWWPAGPVEARGGRTPGEPAGRGLLPTPRATRGGSNTETVGLLPTPMSRDHKGAGPADMNRHSPNLSAVGALLPTPAVNDMGEGKTPDAWDEWTAKMQAAHGNGNGHGKSLSIEAQRLLPTPTTTQRGEDVEARNGRPGAGPNLHNEVTPERWGMYAEAIARWEHLTRPAPPPTQPSKKGTPQLSPRFSEWLMGLPDGWVTDVPGLTRNQMLKLLGNGVVPAQAVAALTHLLAVEAVA